MQRSERGEKDGDLAAHGTAVGQPHVDLEDMPHVRGARHELSRPDAAANAGEAAATMGAQPAVAVEIDVGHAAIPDQRRKSAEGARRAGPISTRAHPMHVVSLRPIGFLQSSQAPFALMQPPSTVAGPPAWQRANGWPCTMVRLSGISAAKPLLPALLPTTYRCHLEKSATLAAIGVAAHRHPPARRSREAWAP